VLGAFHIELDVRGPAIGEDLVQWRHIDNLGSGSDARSGGPGRGELELATLGAYSDRGDLNRPNP